MSTNIKLEMLCKNVRNLRKHYHLSQKEMAGRLHIGIESLKKLERGEVPPRLGINVLLYIYRHFGVTPNKIVTIDVLQEIPQTKNPHNHSHS